MRRAGTTEFFTLGPGAIFERERGAGEIWSCGDSSGKPLSDNFYWMGGTSADYRKLNRLGEAQIKTMVEKRLPTVTNSA